VVTELRALPVGTTLSPLLADWLVDLACYILNQKASIYLSDTMTIYEVWIGNWIYRTLIELLQIRDYR
jgi:hypothetical protein